MDDDTRYRLSLREIESDRLQRMMHRELALVAADAGSSEPRFTVARREWIAHELRSRDALARNAVAR